MVWCLSLILEIFSHFASNISSAPHPLSFPSVFPIICTLGCEILSHSSWMHTLIFFYSFFFVSICIISVVLFLDSPSLSLGKLSSLMSLSKPLFILFTVLFIFTISVSFFPLLPSLFKAVHYFKQKQWKTMQVSLWWDHSVRYFHPVEHMCHHVRKWAYTDMDRVTTCLVLIKQV